MPLQANLCLSMPSQAKECSQWHDSMPLQAKECSQWHDSMPLQAMECSQWHDSMPLQAMECSQWHDSNGAMEQWSAPSGMIAMEQWSNGAMEQWSAPSGMIAGAAGTRHRHAAPLALNSLCIRTRPAQKLLHWILALKSIKS